MTRGRLVITALDFYPRGPLMRATEPPPDGKGSLRVVRLDDKCDCNLDPFMAAVRTTTAVLVMETVFPPFNRADVVQIAKDFSVGLDLLDFAVRKKRLFLPRPRDSP